jgi:hypothetical protein
VKYAVRYKGAGERLAVRAWPLGGRSAAEVLESEPLELEEGALVTEPPASLRHGELPPYLASTGARGIEKALKDRLPDKLALAVFLDPVTKSSSQPGETREAFAARLQGAGGGAKAERLRESIEKKKAELATQEQELAGRKTEKWAAIGTAILSNLGLLTGRKRTISGAGTVLTKNRMENTAEARVEALRAELAGLEGELQSMASVDPARFEEKALLPSGNDVKILRYDVVWVY